jgi:hypothetical protein
MQRDINAVPTMMTLGGQSFAQAFANTFFAVNAGGAPASQPFFEAALGGTGSAFCKGFASCTQAVVKNANMNNFISQTQVFQLWSALSSANGWTLGRTIPSSQGPGIPSGQVASVNADDSSGFSTYHALYATFTTRDWHGVTMTSNFTWGRALGTGNQSQATSAYTVLNPYNVKQSTYGPQFFDYKFLYSHTFLWSEPFFRTNHGILGHALGGWRLAAVVAARSGAPLPVYTLNSNESFGETQTSGALDGAVLASKYTGGSSAHYNVNVPNSASGAGVNGNLGNGGNNMNMFTNPDAIYNEFRQCVLGYDTSCGSSGQIRGLPNWNMDANIAKDFRVFRERVFATMSFQFVNVFNHVTLRDPYLDISDAPDFGILGSNNPNGTGQVNAPRNLTFNLRLRF